MTSKPAILPLFPHKVRGREPDRLDADPTEARDSVRFHREAARLSVEVGEDAAVEVGAPALLIGSRPKQMAASPAQSTEVHVPCLPAPSRFARQRLGRKSRVVEQELNDLALVFRQRLFGERLDDALRPVEVLDVTGKLLAPCRLGGVEGFEEGLGVGRPVCMAFRDPGERAIPKRAPLPLVHLRNRLDDPFNAHSAPPPHPLFPPASGLIFPITPFNVS